MTPKTRPRTTTQVLQQQKQNAEAARAAAAEQAAKAATTAPTKLDAKLNETTALVPAQSTAVAVPDTRSALDKYLDEIAPTGIVGRMVKFDKSGEFVTPDDGEKISDSVDFIAMCDGVMAGFLKFHEDAPPDRVMGLPYDGFCLPPRESLGDLDPAQWPLGLSQKPEDPWRHMMYLPLQQVDTGALFTFTTGSKTGRRAVGSLLRHYNRMLTSQPDHYPVVRLRKGGFQHRDERIGWVATPTFAVVGRAPKDSAVKPDTSPSGDLDDEIRF